MKINKKQTIEVTVSPDGGIQIDAEGFTGKSCVEATAFLEEALGNVGNRQRTRDYYRKEKAGTKNTNQQKGGAGT